MRPSASIYFKCDKSQVFYYCNTHNDTTKPGKELRSEAQHGETDARNNIETKGQNQRCWNVSQLMVAGKSSGHSRRGKGSCFSFPQELQKGIIFVESKDKGIL